MSLSEAPAECRIPHDEPDVLPRFLCRRCSPTKRELMSAEERARDDAEFYNAIRAKQSAEDAERKLQRDIEKTRRDLDRLMAREPEEGSVSHKIMLSLQTKLAKLEGLI